jgi:hypothetical protein
MHKRATLWEWECNCCVAGILILWRTSQYGQQSSLEYNRRERARQNDGNCRSLELNVEYIVNVRVEELYSHSNMYDCKQRTH